MSRLYTVTLLTYVQSAWVHAKSLQLYQLCDPMDCSLPASSVHRMLQARILEWLPWPPPGDLPDLGLNLSLLCFLHRQMGSLSLAPPGKPPYGECIIRNARLDESQWNQDYLEKYQQPQICRWYHCNGRKRRGTKGLLDEGERGKWKACLTLNIQMTKTMASGFISSVQFSHSLVSDSLWPHGLQHARSPCHFMANRWRKNRNSDRLYFLGLQNHWGLWL